MIQSHIYEPFSRAWKRPESRTHDDGETIGLFKPLMVSEGFPDRAGLTTWAGGEMRRLPMRKFKDVLRPHAAGRSARQIGPSVGLGCSTVADYLRGAELAGLSWPLPESLDEMALERLLFSPSPPTKVRQFAEPDWMAVHRELKRPEVRLPALLTAAAMWPRRLVSISVSPPAN